MHPCSSTSCTHVQGKYAIPPRLLPPPSHRRFAPVLRARSTTPGTKRGRPPPCGEATSTHQHEKEEAEEAEEVEEEEGNAETNNGAAVAAASLFIPRRGAS
eukprot:GHVT01038251.1.p1 GENE.GHVT01038251.1~~GHVT01038251.1.p1  ORF type:complete len:101 (-),score=26.70 GHVT01038251.1:138-440(-)